MYIEDFDWDDANIEHIIPKDMTEEEAAEFYSSHDLGDIWDKLEPVEEPIELSPELQRTIRLRLKHHYLRAIQQLAERKGIPYRALIRSWVIERIEAEELDSTLP